MWIQLVPACSWTLWFTQVNLKTLFPPLILSLRQRIFKWLSIDSTYFMILWTTVSTYFDSRHVEADYLIKFSFFSFWKISFLKNVPNVSNFEHCSTLRYILSRQVGAQHWKPFRKDWKITKMLTKNRKKTLPNQKFTFHVFIYFSGYFNIFENPFLRQIVDLVELKI